MLIEFIFFKLTFYKHNRLEKYYSSISYSLITIIIFLFYFCQFYGYKNWDAPFTIELFKIYFIHINEILSAISINPIYIYLTIIFVFFIFTLINFYSYNRFYNFFYRLLTIRIKKLSFFHIFVFVFISQYILINNKWNNKDTFHIFYQNNWGVSNIAPKDFYINNLSDFEYDLSQFIKTENKSNITPKHVFLVIIDSLRFDSFMEQDVKELLQKNDHNLNLTSYKNTYSVCPISFCGILGTLSSTYFHNMNKPLLTITDILKFNDFKTSFLLSGDHTHAGGLKRFYGKSIDLYIDGSTSELINSAQYPNNDIYVLKNLSNINFNKKNFAYIHLMSVHGAGLKQKEFEIHKPTYVTNLLSQKQKIQAYRNNYLNGVIQAKNYLSHILNFIKTNTDDPFVVIVTSDHGEFLGENGRVGHGGFVLEPVTRIPLHFISNYNLKLAKNDLASNADIPPTILDFLNIKIPNNWDGKSLSMINKNRIVYSSNNLSSTIKLYDLKTQRLYSYLEYSYDKCYDEHIKFSSIYPDCMAPILKSNILITESLTNYHNKSFGKK